VVKVLLYVFVSCCLCACGIYFYTLLSWCRTDFWIWNDVVVTETC